MEKLKDYKTQEKLAKVFKAVISAGLAAPVFVSVSACEKAKPVVEEAQTRTMIPSTIEVTPTSSSVETASPATETTVEIEKIDVPEIPGLTFNQETRKYLNEVGVEMGVWIENAVKINGELVPAIALKREAINKILEVNKEKGVFKCPWPFDWQKDKDMEVVEVFDSFSYEQKCFKKDGIYIPSNIAVKFSEPINFYAPFDVNNEGVKAVAELFPKNQDDPDFFSSQTLKIITLTTAISYDPEGEDDKRHGSIQFSFLDWKHAVALSESYNLGNDGLGRDIMGEIKAGNLLGEILPGTSDFNFLDFLNNPEFVENPGQFQGRLFVFDFSDDFSKPTSSLEKMLKYSNKAGQEIPVCVWSEGNTTAHEQTN